MKLVTIATIIVIAMAGLAFSSGDTDCDGDRDPADALVILRYVAGLPAGLVCTDALDFDQDGDVDPIDALKLLIAVANDANDANDEGGEIIVIPYKPIIR